MTIHGGQASPPPPGHYRASDGRDYPVPAGYVLGQDGQLYPAATLPPPPGPPVAAPVAAPAGPARSGWVWGPASILVLVGAVGIVIGAFLPWARVGPFTVSGTDGDGSITLILGLLAAALGVAGIAKASKGMAIGSLVSAALVVVIGIIDWADISSTDPGPFAIEAKVGGGLVLTVIGGLIGVIGAALALRRRA